MSHENKTDLQLAVGEITEKEDEYNSLFDYYEGEHPLVYANSNIRNFFPFSKLEARFVQNWMGVVIDACSNRINLDKFLFPDAENDLAVAFEKLWNETGMVQDSQSVHLATLITGEAFVIVWPDELSKTGISTYYNDPRLCTIIYEDDRPKEKRVAAKMHTSNHKAHLTLYYKDTIEYYVAPKKENIQIDPNSFILDDTISINPAPNPYGIIPVFHFRRDNRDIQGEFESVIPLQDSINKLYADMMVAEEYGAFPQRWIITNAETSSLKNDPNLIWFLPAGDGVGQSTAVGQFATADIGTFLSSMNQFAQSIAIITSTPKHYFFGQGGTPSGEALIAMEAPLNSKCKRYIMNFKSIWQDIARFILQIQGVQVGDIVAKFDTPSTIQPLTQAKIISEAVRSGMPLETALRELALWSDTKIQAMQADKEKEAVAGKQQLATALLNAQASTAAGQQSNGLENIDSNQQNNSNENQDEARDTSV